MATFLNHQGNQFYLYFNHVFSVCSSKKKKIRFVVRARTSSFCFLQHFCQSEPHVQYSNSQCRPQVGNLTHYHLNSLLLLSLERGCYLSFLQFIPCLLGLQKKKMHTLLTECDKLPFKIEVFQHHNDLASLWCRICPAAHLTPFNIIPVKTLKVNVESVHASQAASLLPTPYQFFTKMPHVS